MKSTLDCMACFVRQSLDAARLISPDSDVHEHILRDVLRWAADMDLNIPPPVLGQRIHRRLRQLTGVADPYGAAKEEMNRLALNLLPELKAEVDRAADPLQTALRFALAGNTIDMGMNSRISESDVRRAIRKAASAPLPGSLSRFKQDAARAREILYLADNAGEIVFDRLLIEQLGTQRVTLAVRGGPVLNDATMADAMAAGLHELVRVIDNGSDAPGTILEDCHADFIRYFNDADMIISKGQGNFETLSGAPHPIYFLFKVKCAVIADHIGQPAGTHMLWRSHANIL